MGRCVAFRPAVGPWIVVLLTAMLAAGCQDGSVPNVITSPEGKPAYEGAKPPPTTPADPAVVVFKKQGGHPPYDLKVMDADGSHVTTIYSTTNINHGSPSWSPDGHSIAFYDRSDLWRIDVVLTNGVPTGANLTPLLDRATSVARPAWSPRGDLIAFLDINLKTIEVIPAVGGPATVLYTYAPASVWSLAWNRDGTQIAFSEGNAIRILTIGSGTVTTALGPEWGQQFGTPMELDWARTQEVLAFCAGAATTHNQAVYTLQLPSGTPIFRAEGYYSTWSPDDSAILFQRQSLRKFFLATGLITALGTSGEQPDWRRF